MRRSIEYYMGLRYKIKLRPIPDEEGGGYVASIPELGEKAFRGEGMDEKEALLSLKAVQRDLFEDYLRNRITIPKPRTEPKYSGKFLLRIEPRWHKYLADMAESHGESLNQYVVNLLISGSLVDDTESLFDRTFRSIERKFEEFLVKREYGYGNKPIWKSPEWSEKEMFAEVFTKQPNGI
jgi:antitoxin HicB